MKKIFLLLIFVISMFILNIRVNAFTMVKGKPLNIVSDGVTHEIFEKYTAEDHTMLYCISGANVMLHAGTGYTEVNYLSEIQKLTIGNIITSNLTYAQKESAIFTYLQKVGKVTDEKDPSYITQANSLNFANNYLNAVSTLNEARLDFKLNGDNYESQSVTVGSTAPISSITYNVTSTNSSLTPTVQRNDANNSFKVIIPKNQIDNIATLATIKVDVTVNISSPSIKIYTYDSSHQDLAMLTTTSKNLTNTISGEVGKPKLIINKVDDKSQPVSDAKIKIECISENCNFKPQTITTDDQQYILNDISYGTYKITELESPDGYVIDNEPKEVTLSENNLQATITLVNNPTKVEISKVSVADGKLLKGAKLHIEDTKGKIVKYCTELENNECKWESGEEVLTITGMPNGSYYLVETSAPEGYALQKEKVRFEVDGKKSIVKVKMENSIEIDVPDTLSGQSVLLITISMFLIALGIGILTYVKKKKA